MVESIEVNETNLPVSISNPVHKRYVSYLIDHINRFQFYLTNSLVLGP